MKTFLLGVGAQKAGTSWLHQYLASAPNVAALQIKEYHVWDALHIPECRRFLVSKEQSERSVQDRLRFSLQQSPSRYFAHFSALLEQSSRPVTCDITPSYAGLSREVFGEIQQGFRELGIRTRAVFFLRDPVERCWSAARMTSRNESGQTKVTSEQVLTYVRSEACEIRTRYDKTIGELEAVFDPGNLFVGLYEQLHEAEQLQAVSDFCHVSFRPALLERKVNANPKANPLDDDTLRLIATHYREVYEFMAVRIPMAKALWPGYKYL